jgi:hypothetical protein
MEKLLEKIRFLEAENVVLKKLVVKLQAELALLRKNSGNASKPPSSDIVKPPKDNL